MLLRCCFTVQYPSPFGEHHAVVNSTNSTPTFPGYGLSSSRKRNVFTEQEYVLNPIQSSCHVTIESMCNVISVINSRRIPCHFILTGEMMSRDVLTGDFHYNDMRCNVSNLPISLVLIKLSVQPNQAEIDTQFDVIAQQRRANVVFRFNLGRMKLHPHNCIINKEKCVQLVSYTCYF